MEGERATLSPVFFFSLSLAASVRLGIAARASKLVWYTVQYSRVPTPCTPYFFFPFSLVLSMLGAGALFLSHALRICPRTLTVGYVGLFVVVVVAGGCWVTAFG